MLRMIHIRVFISLYFSLIVVVFGEISLPHHVIRGLRENTMEIKQNDAIFRPCGDEHVPYLPGTTRMQFGYNFITDKIAMHGSHLEILDTFTTTKRNIRVEYKGKCYKIPDAFASEENYGIDFRSISSSKFTSVEGSSAAENRMQISKNREAEVGLEVRGYDAAVEASFSHSSDTKMKRDNTMGTTNDVGESVYVNYMYGLQVKHPIPSRRIIHRWKKLYKNALRASNPSQVYDLFVDYFHAQGTHYFSAGMVGGEWKIGYTVDRYEQTTSNSNKKGRSNCLNAKISGEYMNVKGSAHTNLCLKEFKNVTDDSTFVSLTKSSWSVCQGGSSVCPHGPGYDPLPQEALKKWKENIDQDPELISGSKRWIPSLIDFIITFADYSPSAVYKDRLYQFSEAPTFQKKIDEMKHFRSLMYENLLKYIKEHNYCKLYPKDPYCGRCFDKCWDRKAIAYNPRTEECQCEPKPVKPTPKPLTDRDCYWSYRRVQCEPVGRCSYQYKFWDWTLSTSCRVKKN